MESPLFARENDGKIMEALVGKRWENHGTSVGESPIASFYFTTVNQRTQWAIFYSYLSLPEGHEW